MDRVILIQIIINDNHDCEYQSTLNKVMTMTWCEFNVGADVSHLFIYHVRMGRERRILLLLFVLVMITVADAILRHPFICILLNVVCN